MNLNDLKVGEAAVIEGIHPKDDLVLKPATLGLVRGSVVRLLSSQDTLIELGLYGNSLVITRQAASRYSCKKLD